MADQLVPHDIDGNSFAVNPFRQDGIPETFREVQFCYSREADGVRCMWCERRCLVKSGQIGFCHTKVNLDGKLYSTIYGVVSTCSADPIEKKPVFHFRPGSRVLTLGTLGCNFRCDFCQNWEISYASGMNSGGLNRPNLLPQKAVELAIAQKCQGIGWSFNEPSIWTEYVLECAMIARQRGLYTVYVTNGYITPEALDVLGASIDVYRVDVKSLSSEFYAKLAHGAGVREILATTIRAKTKWRMHVEVATNIVPGWNDDEENLNLTARWIVGTLGAETPWHVTRFVPYAKMLHVLPTPTDRVQKAIEIGHANGLEFVYSDDPAIPESGATYCPNCHGELISRKADRIRTQPGLEGGACPFCGSEMSIAW